MGLADAIRSKTPKYPTSLNIALTAIFMGITTVFTMFIQIPIPATTGYINIGEAGVFLSALLLGPVGGAIAGGVGSALADWITGYVFYAPWTLLIKGLEGLIVGLFSRRKAIHNAIVVVVAGLWMVTGYFIVQGFILFTVPIALVELPWNLLQVAAGAVIALPVATIARQAMPYPAEGPPEKIEPETKG